MEIQLSPPLAQRAQELAAEHHTTLDQWLNNVVLEEIVHAEMQKRQLRATLEKAMAEADRGEGDDMDTVFTRILSRFQ